MEKWVKILVTILIIGNIVGWSLVNSHQDRIDEYQQQVKELEWENKELEQRNDDLNYELDGLIEELRAFYHKPVDLTGIEETNRSHALKDIVGDSRFWNKRQDVDKFLEALLSMRDVISWYDMVEKFVLYEWDAIDLTESYWEKLKDNGIISVIVVGNLDLPSETFSESNHSWLLVFYRDWDKDGWSKEEPLLALIFEPTKRGCFVIHVAHNAPRQYLQGYFYTSPFELEADIEER